MYANFTSKSACYYTFTSDHGHQYIIFLRPGNHGSCCSSPCALSLDSSIVRANIEIVNMQQTAKEAGGVDIEHRCPLKLPRFLPTISDTDLSPPYQHKLQPTTSTNHRTSTPESLNTTKGVISTMPCPHCTYVKTCASHTEHSHSETVH
jgi:hypothetical protein